MAKSPLRLLGTRWSNIALTTGRIGRFHHSSTGYPWGNILLACSTSMEAARSIMLKPLKSQPQAPRKFQLLAQALPLIVVIRVLCSKSQLMVEMTIYCTQLMEDKVGIQIQRSTIQVLVIMPSVSDMRMAAVKQMPVKASVSSPRKPRKSPISWWSKHLAVKPTMHRQLS